MAKRPRPTLFDYALIAINPTLVMLMVGSLMFFLVVVMYRGEFESRLCFILAMFVMAIVLITRISIEEGTHYAACFAIPLAIVVFLALGRFVTFPGSLAPFALVINVGLMALIWWSSHRITWDCTVIDESVEAPGEGLLQTAGLESGRREVTSPAEDLVGTTVTAEQSRKTESSASDGSTLKRVWNAYRQVSHRPHSHGMWVVYFSIAALPIFGLGQGFVDSLGGRRYAFLLFCIYLLSSFALLMTTSLLGLRRYLRQRHLEMPASMPAAWFGTGALLILAILLLCLILPRPYPEYSVSHLDWFATSPVTLETNFWGTFEGKESPDGTGREDQQSEGGSQQSEGGSQQSEGGSQQSDGGSQQSKGGNQQSEGGGQQPAVESQSGENQSSQGQSSQGQSSQGQSSQNQSSQNQSSQNQSSQNQSSQGRENEREGGSESADPVNANSAENSSGSTSSSGTRSAASDPSTRRQGGRATSSARSPLSLPSFSPSIANFLKFLYYLAVIVICGFLLWRYREQLAEGWRKFLDELRKLRDKWGHAPEAVSEEATAVRPTRRERPFSAFSNPFLPGAEARRPDAELVRYSFSALEAWGREHEVARRGEETPLEFARRMGTERPALAHVSRDVCLLYSQLAYGGGELPRETSQHLEHFWKVLERHTADVGQTVPSLPE